MACPNCYLNEQEVEDLEEKVMRLLIVLGKIAEGPHQEKDHKCQPYCLACRAQKALKEHSNGNLHL